MQKKMDLKNKAVMWAAVGCVLAVATVTSVKPAKAADSPQTGEKPNVVIMLADNVGWGDIGAYGGGEIRGMPTPNIDRLASEGMQMTQFLVEPACTPSRAALLTGRYSTRVGLNTVIIGGTPNTLTAQEIALAEVFKEKDYATAYAGKWHLGMEGNWLQTVPGKSWFICLRMYGATEPWLNKTWRPSEIELVK